MRIIHVHWLPPLSRIIPSWRTTIRTPVPLPPCRIPSRWRGPIRPLPSSSWRRIPIRILIRVSIIIHWYPVCLLFLPISIITALVRVRRGRRILLVTHPSCLVYSAEYHSTRCAQCPSFPDYLYNQSHSFFRASHSPCGSAARQQILPLQAPTRYRSTESVYFLLYTPPLSIRLPNKYSDTTKK